MLCCLISPRFASGVLPDFTELAVKVSPAVVNISTTKLVQSPGGYRNPALRDPFFDEFFEHFFGVPPGSPGLQGQEQRAQHSLGSGFVISASGDILTNNHVVEGADEIVVKFADEKEYKAEVIGRDVKTDIAVIRVKGKELPYVELGDSDVLRIGDWVLAIGNPFGLGQTVTAGIVSAKGRVIGAGPYDDFIQTDASINPGNSGGPLFNMEGKVVGINTAIIASGQGIGFAIPITMAKTLVPQLIKEGHASRGWLGVAIQELTDELAESYGLKGSKGVLLAGIEPAGPADRAGLKAGDIVLKYNGQEVKNTHALPLLVSQTPVGQTATLEIWRDRGVKTVSVQIGHMQDDSQVTTTGKGATPSQKVNALGLALQAVTAEEARQLGLDPSHSGVSVVYVEPGSGADQVQIMRGDIILDINNRAIRTVEDFDKTLLSLKKGEMIRLFIQRGQVKTFLAFRKSF